MSLTTLTVQFGSISPVTVGNLQNLITRSKCVLLATTALCELEPTSFFLLLRFTGRRTIIFNSNLLYANIYPDPTFVVAFFFFLICVYSRMQGILLMASKSM
jgi:hypothetical protein